MVQNLFGFDDPRDNPRKKEILEAFDHTPFMIASQKEAAPFGLHYQVMQTDELDMAFNRQRLVNPSSYILRIERVFRVYHQELKKEFLYYYVSEQVKGLSPAETMPGIEFENQGFRGIHPRPLIKPEGYDYKGNPVNIRIKGTEWKFEIDWSPKALDDLLADPDNKFGNTKFFVAMAPLDTSRQAPSPKYEVKSKDDFKNGNIFDLMEMAQSKTEFTNLLEFQETKNAQKKARADLVVKKNNRPSSSSSGGASV